MKSAETVIIGAGISGLTAAVLLAEAGKSVILLEAQAQAGGRVQSVLDDAGHFLGDLGPTWVWPSFQPTLTRWVEKLALQLVPQYVRGLSILDHGVGHPPQKGHMPAQKGNMRLDGGSQEIVNALRTRLPRDVLRTHCPVKGIHFVKDGVEIRLHDEASCSLTSQTLTCKNIIVAVAPRIAARTIDWHPQLPSPLKADMLETPTWMAPHAKVVALYENAFWRDQNISGRIASRAGPIVEAHDHCGPNGTPAAIFGFIGWPHALRLQHPQELRQQIEAQLMRCFGKGNAPPKELHIKDWAINPYVTSPEDLDTPMHHPSRRPDSLRASYFDHRLIFASAETADISPGLIEGAFDAGERAAENYFK